MSTPEYDMAPPGATASAPSRVAQPQASGAAVDAAPERTRRRRAASQKKGDLSGIYIPTGILTGLIALCWMIHSFGLGATIFALLATAAATTAALAIRDGRRAAQDARRQNQPGGAGGGGPGRRGGGDGRPGGSGRSGGGASPAPTGNRTGGGTGPSRNGGAGPGPLTRKPEGMGPKKQAPNGPKNSSAPSPNPPKAPLAPKSGGGPKPAPAGAAAGGKNTAPGGGSGGKGDRKDGGLRGALGGGKDGGPGPASGGKAPKGLDSKAGTRGGLSGGGKNETPGSKGGDKPPAPKGTGGPKPSLRDRLGGGAGKDGGPGPASGGKAPKGLDSKAGTRGGLSGGGKNETPGSKGGDKPPAPKGTGGPKPSLRDRLGGGAGKDGGPGPASGGKAPKGLDSKAGREGLSDGGEKNSGSLKRLKEMLGKHGTKGGSGSRAGDTKDPGRQENGTGRGSGGSKDAAGGESGAAKRAPKGAKHPGGGKKTPSTEGGKGAKHRLLRKLKDRVGKSTTSSKGTSPMASAKAAVKGPSPAKKRSTVGQARVPRHRRYTWKQPHLKTAAGAKNLYTQMTSRKARRRIHRVMTPLRAMYRGARRRGTRVLATVLRYGSRGLLSAHAALGDVRYSTAGPNWLRALSRAMHWATSPLAKLVQVSRTWGWMTSWIYATAAGPLRTRTTTAKATTAPAAGTGGVGPGPSGGHAPVPTPSAASAAKGTPVDTSPVHHAYPLIFAADTIRAAGQSFAAAPADSMKGYEAVIETLGHVNLSLFELMQRVATLTEEEFKVSQHIPEQFRAISVHFLALGGFIDAVHGMYRQLHHEQIDNYENPTWAGRKWDVSANWGTAIPMYAWASADVHRTPLLFAAAAVRDAGIVLQSNPAGSMVGYEQVIEHLPLLSEALAELMETVARVTEAEFAVHPAVPEAHRDAGVRYRDLSGAISGVHYLYRVLHQQQLQNLENPTHQAAKWDQSRNL